MKKRIHLILYLLGMMLLCGCSKTEINYIEQYEKPVLGETKVSAITSFSAVMTGNVADDGGKIVNSRGFIFRTYSFDPKAEGGVIIELGRGKGNFSVEIDTLRSATTYYACPYAVNETGETRGSLMSFTTNAAPSNEVSITTDDAKLYQSSYSAAGYQWNGETYHYKYDIVVIFTLKGSANMKECGFSLNEWTFYMDPSSGYSDKTYDTQYGSIYSNSASISVICCAYADKTDGGRIYGATKTITATYPASSSAPQLQRAEKYLKLSVKNLYSLSE